MIMLSFLWSCCLFYFSDNHDIISLKVYDIETNRPEDSIDYRKIKPSADFFASPRGELYFLCISLIFISIINTFQYFPQFAFCKWFLKLSSLKVLGYIFLLILAKKLDLVFIFPLFRASTGWAANFLVFWISSFSSDIFHYRDISSVIYGWFYILHKQMGEPTQTFLLIAWPLHVLFL